MRSSTFTWRPAALPDDIAALIAYGATDTDCDLWKGTVRAGYGVLRVRVAGMTGTTRPIQAHRFIYEVATGQVIPGRMNGEPVELDHKCRQPPRRPCPPMRRRHPRQARPPRLKKPGTPASHRR